MPEQGAHLRQARVEAGEGGVVVAGVAVLAARPQAGRELVVAGGHDPAFARDEQLRGRGREDLGETGAADRVAVVQGAEAVCGVVDDGHPAAAPDPSSASWSAGAPKTCTGTMRRVRSLSASSTRFGSSVQVSGSMSQKTGVRPAQAAAVAVAMKVKLGMIASPPRKRSKTSMRPAVHDETATAWRTPRCSASRRSYSSSAGPLVTMPLAKASRRPGSSASSGGSVGRSRRRPSGKAGEPPRMAGVRAVIRAMLPENDGAGRAASDRGAVPPRAWRRRQATAAGSGAR